MKIAIEAQRIFRPNKHGMDFVALETIRCLQRLDTKNEYFIFTGEGEDRCLEESPNMHITTLRCPSYPLWEQWAAGFVIFMLTGGGPNYPGLPIIMGETDILISMVYSVAFESGVKQSGLASALSSMIFFIVGFISWLGFRQTRKLEEIM